MHDEDFALFKHKLSIALAIDYVMLLQNDILAKVDRPTMSVSLEGREPFLDHRIIEFVARLPSTFKYQNHFKVILRDIVHKYVPKELMERPKTGFTIPIYEWLKSDLSPMLEHYLSAESLARSDIFDPSYVEKLKWDLRKDKLYDRTVIWKLLQFQMWQERWMN